MGTITAWVNPLVCPEIARSTLTDEPPGADRLLEYAFAPDVERTSQAFVERYREISTGVDPLPLAPAEPNILAKMVWPLRSAKASYALGNYLSCIAMCGLVGEMVAMLTWDISEVRFQAGQLGETQEKLLLGSSFERLGQERRVSVLFAAGLIDESAKRAFDSLREIRRKHLHLFSHPHSEAERDARAAFSAAAEALKQLFRFTVESDDVSLRPELTTYLVKHGILKP